MKLSIVSASQIYQALRFGGWVATSVLLSKSYFTQEQIGHYEQLMMMGTFFSFFWVSGLFTTLLSQFMKVEDVRRPTYLFNHFVVYLLFNVLYLLMFQLGAQSISWALTGRQLEYVPWMSGVFFLNNLSYYIEHIYILERREKSLLRYSIFNFCLQVIVVFLALQWGHGVRDVLLGLILFGAIKLLWMLKELYHHTRVCVDKALVRSILINTAPLLLSFFIMNSNDFIDMMIISHRFDQATFSSYVYGAREFMIANILVQGLSASILPMLSTSLDEGLQVLKSKTMFYTRILFPVVSVLMFATYFIFPILFNPKFEITWFITNTYFLLVIPRMILPQTILNALNKNKILLFVSIAEMLVNVASTLLLLQFFGIIGVALGTVCAYVFEKIVLIYLVKRWAGVSLSQYLVSREYILWSALVLLAYISSLWLFMK